MRHILLAAAAILLASCSSSSNKPKPAAQLPEPAAATPVEPTESHEPVAAQTQVEMVNVNIHLDTELILHIRYLTGKFLSTRKGQPPTFDDKRSYVVAIDSGKVGVSMASMTHALNTYVFSEPDAPLKNLQLTSEGSQLRQKGTLQKGPGLPFEMLGTVSATPDGKMRIHPTEMKVAHLVFLVLISLAMSSPNSFISPFTGKCATFISVGWIRILPSCVALTVPNISKGSPGPF